MRIIGLLIFLFGMIQGGDKTPPREASAIAPSLPKLSDEQEAKLDAIIDRFILFDTGKLSGDSGQKAKADFQKLGIESTPALLRGLQKASRIDHSCPVAMITQKLRGILLTSNDSELLDFARDEISAAVEDSRHSLLLRDLRARVTIQRNKAIAANPPIPRWLRDLTIKEMVEALRRNDNTPRLLAMARELARRQEKEALDGLALFAASFYREISEPSLALLQKRLKDLRTEELLGLLSDANPTLRARAVEAISESKAKPRYKDILPLIEDKDPAVRQSARKTLIQWGNGKDFGPEERADANAQKKSREDWQKHFEGLAR